MDTVARLQREVEELRSGSHQTVFTSTNVPRLAGLTSWDQYRQVFDAIVVSMVWTMRPQHCSCFRI